MMFKVCFKCLFDYFYRNWSVFCLLFRSHFSVFFLTFLFADTPVHLAARFGQHDVLRLLLRFRVLLDARNQQGLTALDVASTDACRALLSGAQGGGATSLLAASPRPAQSLLAGQDGRPSPVYRSVVRRWSIAQVGSWLKEIGLGAYTHWFCENEVDGQSLLLLSRDDFAKLVPDRASLSVLMKSMENVKE